MRRPLTVNRGTRAGRIAPILAAMVLAVLLLASPGAVDAQTWNGSVSDLWGTAANWTPNTVPNSSGANVIITSATNNPVLININPTIANLTLGGAESLTLTDGHVFTIAGGGGNGMINNAGVITLNSAGSFTDLRIGGDVSLTGGGTVTLSNFTTNRIDQASGGSILTNVDNTIQGSGQIGVNGLSLVNQAWTIDANQSTCAVDQCRRHDEHRDARGHRGRHTQSLVPHHQYERHHPLLGRRFRCEPERQHDHRAARSRRAAAGS